jgi:hypothetical protein
VESPGNFTGVWAANDRGPTGALPRNPQTGSFSFGSSLLLDFLLGLADLLFQLGMQLVRALVLGQLAQHHLKTIQFFFGRASAAVCFFCFQILLSQISWHGVACERSKTQTSFLHSQESSAHAIQCSNLSASRLVEPARRQYAVLGTLVLNASTGARGCFAGERMCDRGTGGRRLQLTHLVVRAGPDSNVCRANGR